MKFNIYIYSFIYHKHGFWNWRRLKFNEIQLQAEYGWSLTFNENTHSFNKYAYILRLNNLPSNGKYYPFFNCVGGCGRAGWCDGVVGLQLGGGGFSCWLYTNVCKRAQDLWSNDRKCIKIRNVCCALRRWCRCRRRERTPTH